MNRRIILSVFLTALIVGGGFYIYHKLSKERIKVEKEVEYFPVYGPDKNGMNIEVNFYVEIPDNLSVIEKLRILADKLSRFEFNLPIEVLSIGEENYKKIAIINLLEYKWNSESSELKDSSDSAGISWHFDYFQGSTGGFFTTKTLIETFLQEDYSGEWIDGVEFYYEGKSISNDWDHISLSGTIYRKKKGPKN
jgi:hypothetical protein